MALDPETFDALIDTVRRFVAERLRPLEEKVAEEDEIPDESSARCGRWGCSACPSPRNMAASASPCRRRCRVALEFGRTTPAFRSVFGTNVGIGSQGLVMAGSRRAEGRMAAAASPAARSSPASR